MFENKNPATRQKFSLHDNGWQGIFAIRGLIFSE